MDTLTTKATETEKVTLYLQGLKHPLSPVAVGLRKILLSADTSIGEEIKWNAPAFFYTGPMKLFNAKDYRRHLLVFNFGKKDAIRLIFLGADKLDNKAGMLEGNFPDGRRIASFKSLEAVERYENTLKRLVQEWLRFLEY